MGLSFKEIPCEEEKIRAMFEGKSEIKKGFYERYDTFSLLKKIIL